MRLLLDTHVAVWFFDDPDLLTSEACEAIEDPSNIAYLSAASVWEWALKLASGRISMPIEMSEAAQLAGFRELPVTWRHGSAASALPALHGDPFDRMLVAQALVDELVLVTRDREIQRYGVATMAA